MDVYKFAEMQYEWSKKSFSSLASFLEALNVLKKLDTK